MSSAGSHFDPLASANSLTELLSALEQSLIDETEALRKRDVDALEQAVARKRHYLTALGRHRPAAGGKGPSPEAASKATALLERCRALNEIAGGAIAAQRQNLSHALGLLGIDSSASAYAAPGYAVPSGPVRTARSLAVG